MHYPTVLAVSPPPRVNTNVLSHISYQGQLFFVYDSVTVLNMKNHLGNFLFLYEQWKYSKQRKNFQHDTLSFNCDVHIHNMTDINIILAPNSVLFWDKYYIYESILYKLKVICMNFTHSMVSNFYYISVRV